MFFFIQALIDRVQRLKDARTEALAEIEALKQSKQAEFAAYEKSIVGDLEQTVSEFASQTEAQLVRVQEQGLAKADEVVEMLVGKVLNVEPAMHPNIRHAISHNQQ